MNNQRKGIFPESYATYFTRAVDVPITLTADGLKFWIRFYGLTSQELKRDHIDTALARRGIYPEQYWITTRQQMEEVTA